MNMNMNMKSSNNLLHPITFCIPESKIVKSIPFKKKFLSKIIPGCVNTYIYDTEEEYYNEYKESYFAVTLKKAGWDCMRHYEILANGCIPYFINIEECPKNTMALLPKDLLLQANILYNKLKNKTIMELENEEINEYNVLLTKLLDYTRNYLTTSKIANYILQKTNYQSVSRILYLSGDLNPDYLRCLLLHGFKELFGSNFHDYPKIPHMYKSNTIHLSNLYGKGMSYANLLEDILHDNKLDDTIEQNIKNKYYDIIIYGSYHRGIPYYDLINKIYKPDEIILLCGEDLHCCNYNQYIQKGHYVFVREL